MKENKNLKILYILLSIFIVIYVFLSRNIYLNNIFTKEFSNFNLSREISLTLEEKDYSSFTKSKLQKEINYLSKLSDATAEWDEIELFYNQVNQDLKNAKECLDNQNYKNPYTDEDLILMAYMISIEAGANITTDEEQCLVGSVILNRKNQNGINKNLNNPTIKDIINEPGQYSIAKYSKKLRKNTRYIDLNSINYDKITDREIKNATKVLEGEFTCPDNVLFQALFIQGPVYKAFYHEHPFNNTTYFCLGKEHK